MTYRGHVENGVIVLDEPADLPEGASVRVELTDDERRPTQADKLRHVIGTIDGPPDLARNHDHYAHGKPKR